MNGPRAADDFATIRARLEELRREREQAMPSGKKVQPHLLLPRDLEHPLAAVRDQGRAGKGSPIYPWYAPRFGVGSLISA